MSDPTNSTIWAGTGKDFDQIKSLQSGPLTIGYNLPAFLQDGVDGKTYTSEFQTTALERIAKDGVFTSLAPSYLFERSYYQWNDGFIYLGRGYLEEKDYQIGEKDVDLYHQTDVQRYVDAYNNFLSLLVSKQRSDVNLSQNNSNNTFILNSASNIDLSLGDGNNVIITSPTMASFSTQTTVHDSGHGLFNKNYVVKLYSNVFFPSSQGGIRTNNLTLGDGNNLVYYDNSYSKAQTGNGDNIFVPSFGAFNWASNSILPGNQPGSKGSSDYNFIPSKRTLLTPIPAEEGAAGLYNANDLYTGVLNFTSYGPSGISKYTGTENAFQMYQGNSPSLRNNQDNIVGGMRLVGGHGNDTFYGMDPNFYNSIGTRDVVMNVLKSDGKLDYAKVFPSERVVFDKAQDATNARLSLQNFETIEFLGGGGNNIFYLGNPTHLSADGSQYNGRFSYKISAAHEKYGDDADRANLMWGEGSSAVSSININLSANVETYKLSSSSFEQNKGKDAPVLDTIKMGTSIANATNKFFDKVMEKGKVWKFIPYADFALSSVSAVVDSIKAIKGLIGVAPDPEPIKLSEMQFKQPLGSWKQAIYVDDWHPNLVLNISVDPTTTTSKDLRWGNIVFNVNPPDSSSQSLDGVTITHQQGSDVARDLFRLNGLGSSKSGSAPDFGYYSYDFRKGEYRVITEKDLAFFGQIANDVKGIDPISDYAAKNGFVFSSTSSALPSAYGSNSYIFYWNDAGRNPVTGEDHTEKWLQDARNSASQLSIQFDSRQMGWFWDPHLVADPAGEPNALTIDKAQSKLWVELSIGKWTAFSWLDLEKQPLAYSYALKAKTFYQVNEKGETKVDRDQITTKKIIESLVQLDKSVPNLDNLGRRDLEAKTYLSSVDQITFVNEGLYTPPPSGFNPNPKTYQGQWIYYLYDDADPTTSDVFKAFVYYDELPGRFQLGQTYNANFKKVLSFSEVYKTEELNKVDINLDGMIGGSPAKALLSSQGVAGPATPDAPVPNEIKTTSDLVSNFYLACLNRDPDQGGLRAWVNAIDSQALTKADALARIVGSEEFLAQQGSATEFVIRLYETFLIRDPSSEELDAWRDAIDDGMALSNVVNGFATSAEFKALVGIANQG